MFLKLVVWFFLMFSNWVRVILLEFGSGVV